MKTSMRMCMLAVILSDAMAVPMMEQNGLDAKLDQLEGKLKALEVKDGEPVLSKSVAAKWDSRTICRTMMIELCKECITRDSKYNYGKGYETYKTDGTCGAWLRAVETPTCRSYVGNPHHGTGSYGTCKTWIRGGVQGRHPGLKALEVKDGKEDKEEELGRAEPVLSKSVAAKWDSRTICRTMMIELCKECITRDSKYNYGKGYETYKTDGTCGAWLRAVETPTCRSYVGNPHHGTGSYGTCKTWIRGGVQGRHPGLKALEVKDGKEANEEGDLDKDGAQA